MSSFLRLASVAAGLSVASSTFAAIIGVAGGSGAPSSTLGSFTMTPFANDTRSNGTSVSSSQTTPIGGVVGFSPSLTLGEVGVDWGTWSHGYTGDVYFSFGESITLTLPAGTGAFYFYAEPNLFGTFNITATSGGVPVAQLTAGNSGANYFGFYGTGGDTISSIIVTFDQGAGGGAVGEFGIAASGASGVPDGGSSVAFFGLAVLALTSLRRRLG